VNIKYQMQKDMII